MSNSNPSVSLHRFRDCGAVAILGNEGDTVYLDAKATRQLARDLARLARSLERETFLNSQYVQESVEASFQAK